MKNFPIIFFVLITTICNGQYGYLDSTFGNNGTVVTAIGLSDIPQASALQSDNKMIVVGGSFIIDSDFLIVRYDADGKLDTSFNKNGKLTIGITPNQHDKANGIAIQKDNKIIVVGMTYTGSDSTFAIIRLNPNGMLDSTFNGNGIVLVNFGPKEDYARAVAIQSDGKIVIVGVTYNGIERDFALTRLNADGSFDNSFGTGGKTTTSFSNKDDVPYAIAIQLDGKILAVGYSNKDTASYGRARIALSRYNANGSLDNSFGSNGLVISDFNGRSDVGRAVAIQTDGKIVVAGESYVSNTDFLVVRYNTNGTLDGSFGNSGNITTPIGGSADFARAIGIQADGKILAAGTSIKGTGAGYTDIALLRYTTKGFLDTTFGNGGICTTAIGTRSEEACGLGIQADGKIVLGGIIQVESSTYNVAAARYISGPLLNVGIANFETEKNSIVVYPNPIAQNTIIEYTLTNDEDISLHLLDGQGRMVYSIVLNERASKGKHLKELILPPNLIQGLYYLALSSPNGTIYVKLIK